MGREIKRVHIDFDLFEREGHTTWKGYLMDEVDCLLCDGSGKNLKGKECPQCYGTGKDSPKIEPPKGYDWEKTDGYQIWQDVSEGGPVSPVFRKPEDLAKWMDENDNSVTRDTTYEGWLRFIKEGGSAPSFISGGGRLGSGVAVLNNEPSSTTGKLNKGGK